MPGGRPPQDTTERFLKYVDKSSDCWLWTGGMHRDGYGKFQIGATKTTSAHRVSFTLFNGPLEKGKHVMHSCDNRRCVNPAHLSLGTPKDNCQDMHAKKRGPTRTAFTESMIAEIHRRLGQGETQQAIADDLGVHQTGISRVKRGKIQKPRKEN